MCHLTFCAQHSLWASVYILAGLLLCVTGAHFVLTYPVTMYGIHVWAAVYDVILGTVILMYSFCNEFTITRCFKLLGMSVSLIVINVISVILFEVGEWQNIIPRELKNSEKYEILIGTRWITLIASGIIITCALIECILICLAIIRAKRDRLRRRFPGRSLETDFDPFPSGSHGVNLRGDSINRYIRSWVPDAESTGCPSPIFQLAALSSERRSALQDPDQICTVTSTQERKVRNAIAQVDLDGDQLGNRQVSASSSDRPYMCECILPELPGGPRKREFYVRPGKLRPWTEGQGYTSSTATASFSWCDDFIPPLPPKLTRYRPENLRLPCATLRPRTVDRGCDAELSKEIDMAIKLIQEIQASKSRADNENLMERLIEMCIDKNDTESTKTISGDSSLDSNGKNTKNLTVESQSTSGYNSPSLDHSLRLTPSTGISSSDLTVSQENSLSCVIQHLGDTAVISLFSPTKQPHRHFSVERVSHVPGEKEFLNGTDNSNRTTSLIELKTKTLDWEEKFAKGKIRKWRHLIDKRRRPSLLPELESAIIKSESLAFLSKSELKDRLDQTKNIHRVIKRRVHRQRSLRRADSLGSVEDMIDIYKMSTCL